MAEPRLVSVNEDAEPLELVVEFGRFAGRDATPAEIDLLSEALLPDLDAVDIVCEGRYRFERDKEAFAYRVRVKVAPEDAELRDDLLETVEEWARDCVGGTPQ